MSFSITHHLIHRDRGSGSEEPSRSNSEASNSYLSGRCMEDPQPRWLPEQTRHNGTFFNGSLCDLAGNLGTGRWTLGRTAYHEPLRGLRTLAPPRVCLIFPGDSRHVPRPRRLLRLHRHRPPEQSPPSGTITSFGLRTRRPIRWRRATIHFPVTLISNGDAGLEPLDQTEPLLEGPRLILFRRRYIADPEPFRNLLPQILHLAPQRCPAPLRLNIPESNIACPATCNLSNTTSMSS